MEQVCSRTPQMLRGGSSAGLQPTPPQQGENRVSVRDWPEAESLNLGTDFRQKCVRLRGHLDPAGWPESSEDKSPPG